ncbi:MAG: NADPH-dependent FMN reductase [Chloroflexota bacterium]
MSVNIVALGGSVRRGSIHRVLLQTAQEVAPEGMEITIFPLNDIPIYNFDVEQGEGFPDSVVALSEAIAAADGLIFATPEYNGSYSGVIKNAIDWASRQGLLGKKCAITMGGSPGALGATKAQEHLRQVCMHLNMYVMPRPTIAVPQLPNKIEDGKLTDEATIGFVKQQMDAFYGWVQRFQD